MTQSGWITSRWVLVPAVLAVAIGSWNLYVARHAHGHVEGQVVDGAGRPVAGATVVLLDRDFIKHTERSRTTTGGDGRFRFADNQNHSLQLEAFAPGRGRSERQDVRLWFRAQDLRLAEPLRLDGGGS